MECVIPPHTNLGRQVTRGIWYSYSQPSLLAKWLRGSSCWLIRCHQSRRDIVWLSSERMLGRYSFLGATKSWRMPRRSFPVSEEFVKSVGISGRLPEPRLVDGVVCSLRKGWCGITSSLWDTVSTKGSYDDITVRGCYAMIAEKFVNLRGGIKGRLRPWACWILRCYA